MRRPCCMTAGVTGSMRMPFPMNRPAGELAAGILEACGFTAGRKKKRDLSCHTSASVIRKWLKKGLSGLIHLCRKQSQTCLPALPGECDWSREKRTCCCGCEWKKEEGKDMYIGGKEFADRGKIYYGESWNVTPDSLLMGKIQPSGCCAEACGNYDKGWHGHPGYRRGVNPAGLYQDFR